MSKLIVKGVGYKSMDCVQLAWSRVQCRLLWAWYWNFGLLKRHWISLLYKWLSAY